MMKKILYNSDDYIFRVGVIIVMMLTTVAAVESRWTACEVRMFYGIPVLLLLGLTILVWKKQKFHYTLTDVIAVIWFVYYIGRVWIGNEWPCQMEFLKTVELFMLYVSLRIAFSGTRLSAWFLIGGILVFGCYEACWGASQLLGYSNSRHYLYSITGNFLNPGPYSAYLMIGVLVGLVALKEVPSKTFIWKHLLVAAIVVMAMILPATLSRSAYVGLSVVALIIYRDKYWKYRYLVWGGLLLIGVFFYFMKQGSADGRLIIAKSTLTTWVHSPWLGVGVGGFLQAFAEGMSQLTANGLEQFSAGVPDGAYNNLMKIIVEQGLLGGVFVGSFTISALIRLSRNSRPLFYGIVALLIFSMFSYPFDLLPYKVIVVMIIAWSEAVEDNKKYELGLVRVFVLIVFLSFCCWQAGKIAKESFYRDKELEVGMSFWHFYSNEDVYDYMAYERDNHEFLFTFGKMLREDRRYNDSNDILRQGTKCSADPMFYVLMGNNYKDMKHDDLAEQAYQKAFSVMPNRLYPLYQLMMLYHDCGNTQKAKAMAKRVIEMKPKIESPATRDMKKKAMEII